MRPSNVTKLNRQIYEEAAQWFVEFRTGDIDSTHRRCFNSWLHTSPEHVRAYLELAAIWNEGSRLDPNHQFDGSELTEFAAETNVVELSAQCKGESSRSSYFPLATFRLPLKLALVASVTIFFIAAASSTWFILQRGVYTTDVGEQRIISLADGTTIELNARSKLRQRYSDHTRNIELLEGQALFHVAKDTTRPFIVKSGNTQVRAVGTEFDVYRKHSATTVTVVQGTVSVTQSAVNSDQAPEPPTNDRSLPAVHFSLPADHRSLILTAGEQAIVTAESAVKPTKPNVEAATAWTQRRLIFESATLIEVANEFNRYNQRRLIIESPELYDFHITGTFSSTDPGSLLRFLQARPGITVTESKDEIRVSRAK